MFGKTTLSLIVAMSVLVAPAAPIEIQKITSPHTSCCSRPALNADPCQRCPMTPSSSGSSSASTCCSVQAPCFVCHANSSEDFVAAIRSFDATRATDDPVTARFQRPPVPPPRIAFS